MLLSISQNTNDCVIGCTVADRGYPPASIRMSFPDGKEAVTTTDTIVHRSFRLKPNYHDNSVICTAETQLDDLKEVTTKKLKVAFGPEKVAIEGNGMSVSCVRLAHHPSFSFFLTSPHISPIPSLFLSSVSSLVPS